MSRVTFSLIVALAIGEPAHAARQQRPLVAFDSGDISSVVQPELSPGDQGSGVLRVQILLERAHFSSGEIEGVFGTNLQKTVTAFQQERRLPTTGKVDAATWTALNADTAPVLMQYTIAPEDEAGPWVSIPKRLTDQSKLDALGYTSALEELGEHFHVSPAVLKALNPQADFGRTGQTLVVPNVLTMPPGQAASVVVTKSESSVRTYDAGGKLLAFYIATIGSAHDPLPIGNWKIVGTRRNPDFHYDGKLFWDARDHDEKAVIKPGPNNPVGLVWMELSKEHYGIHGTPEPALIGHSTSHGCIRLTNWDAVELANMVKPGTPAILKE